MKTRSVSAGTRVASMALVGLGASLLAPAPTADAKITVDGKTVKLDAIPTGAFATFTIIGAKDGQAREASEAVVAGPTFTGTVKQIDATTLTVGAEKSARVVKLAPGGKVLIGEKEGAFADLKVGDTATVTLAADESAAVLIVSGGKKPTGDKPSGDKPKPEKE